MSVWAFLFLLIGVVYATVLLMRFVLWLDGAYRYEATAKHHSYRKTSG